MTLHDLDDGRGDRTSNFTSPKVKFYHNIESQILSLRQKVTLSKHDPKSLCRKSKSIKMIESQKLPITFFPDLTRLKMPLVNLMKYSFYNA